MVQFNCNNGNLFPSYRLPIQSKKGYESLCEVMYEYLGNNACLMNEISQKIRIIPICMRVIQNQTIQI